MYDPAGFSRRWIGQPNPEQFKNKSFVAPAILEVVGEDVSWQIVFFAERIQFVKCKLYLNAIYTIE